MGTQRFSFETNCPDGQKCGATTTGCIVGHCQRKGTATCKHMLNLQAGESHVLSYACPYCKNEELESKLAALEADARRWIPVTEKLPPDETPVLIQMRGGKLRIGELRWERPAYEESFDAYRYWDDPQNDGQCWEWNDIIFWRDLPALSQEPGGK